MASSRSHAFRAKPPGAVVDRMAAARGARMFVVGRPGPTSFVLREAVEARAAGERGGAGPVSAEAADGGDAQAPSSPKSVLGKAKHRVHVGHAQTCSCRAFQREGELCVHLLFVLLRVLRVPATNPAVWQLGLVEREIDEILKCHMATQGAEAKAAAATSAAGRDGAARPPRRRRRKGEVPRRPCEGEPCPICYEEMAAGETGDGVFGAELVWCRKGCGQSVHGRCMRVWGEHQLGTGKELSCPLCRVPWDAAALEWTPQRPPPRTSATAARRAADSHAHHGTRCAACHAAPIRGDRFKCLICEHFDLCEACYHAGRHSRHPFGAKASPTDEHLVPVERDLLPQADSAGHKKAHASAGSHGGQRGDSAADTQVAAAAAVEGGGDDDVSPTGRREHDATLERLLAEGGADGGTDLECTVDDTDGASVDSAAADEDFISRAMAATENALLGLGLSGEAALSATAHSLVVLPLPEVVAAPPARAAITGGRRPLSQGATQRRPVARVGPSGGLGRGRRRGAPSPVPAKPITAPAPLELGVFGTAVSTRR